MCISQVRSSKTAMSDIYVVILESTSIEIFSLSPLVTSSEGIIALMVPTQKRDVLSQS